MSMSSPSNSNSNNTSPPNPSTTVNSSPLPSPSYSYRHSSLREKSFNLQKMSHSISQNLINMQYKSKSHSSKPPPYNNNNSNNNPNIPKPPPPLPTLPTNRTEPILQQLNLFLTHHLSFHRPIALVTSGGTITTLEQNTIRYLDNFSTGQRGAISVEEFCKRGYAVIHLWRVGSTAPYSRVLSKLLGVKQGNYGLDYEALGYLFEGQQSLNQRRRNGGDSGQNGPFASQQQQKGVDGHGSASGTNDPWLSSTKRSKFYHESTSTPNTQSNHPTQSSSPSSNDPHDHTTYYNNNINYEEDKKYTSQNRMQLTTHILHNNLLQRKLRERSDVISNNLLYTIPFKTIEEYIALLKLTTEAMDQCQSLGLIYLAAAVSDFYIPEEEKCVHKIQSRNYDLENDHGNDDEEKKSAGGGGGGAIQMNEVNNSLSLTLQPVPKVIRNLRQEWSPHAFCISFKLETDETILKQKVQNAMQKNDVHLVIGNVLATRHDKVSLFERKASSDEEDSGSTIDLKCTQVTKSDSRSSGLDNDDDLEDNIISHVVEKHFEYIANHYLVDNHTSDIGDIDDDEEEEELKNVGRSGNIRNVLPRTALMTGAEAAARHNAIVRKKKEMLQRELYWKRVRDISLNIAGHALGGYLSFVLSSALQNHLR